MRALDIKLNTLPGEPLEVPDVSLPLENPTNILTQTKSDITTNPFIKPVENDMPVNKSLNEINTNVSITFMGFLDDLFNKPDNQSWPSYLVEIIRKDERYNYFGILLFFISLYILLIK